MPGPDRVPPPPVTVKFPLTVTLPAPARAPPVICMLETACSPAPSVSAPLPDRLRTPDTLDRAALIDTAPVTAVTLPMSRTPGNTGSVRPVLSAPPYSTMSGLLVPVPPAVPVMRMLPSPVPFPPATLGSTSMLPPTSTPPLLAVPCISIAGPLGGEAPVRTGPSKITPQFSWPEPAA